MTSSIKRTLPFIAVFSMGLLWLFTWIQFVNPFPDRDSINQFYFPFLNYLQASRLLQLDTSFLVDNTFSTSYPTGGAIFPWLISKIGVQSYFIQNPFHTFFILLPFIACVPYFFRENIKSRLMIGVLFLALPVTQLSLKGFSLQGFNVIFCLIAILAFRSYLARRNVAYLLIFAVCFWLAIIPKHLGAFYFANFLMAYLIWVFQSGKVDLKIILAILAITLMSAPFYNLDNLQTYLINVITHNPYLSVESFFVIGGSITIIGTLLLMIVNRKSALLRLPKLHNAPLITCILFCFATYLTTVSYDAKIGNRDVVVFFILGYGFLSWLLLRYKIANTRGFILLFCALTYINSTLLFCSMIGKTFYNFFLPIMLMAILEFKETRSFQKKTLFLIITLLFSNFFPSIHQIEKLMGERGENIYINGFNAVYINPLGWNKCQIPELRSKLETIYSNSKFESESSLYIAEKLHFHTKLALEFPLNYFFPFPSIYRLDNLPPERIQTLLNEYKVIGEKVFWKWLEEHKIQLILVGKKSFTNFVGEPPNIESIIKNDHFELNDAARSLSREFLKFLQKNKHLQTFYACQSIPAKEPRLKVCILKKLQAANIDHGKWNRPLSDLATRHEMAHQRPLPDWINNLGDENRLRLEQKRAGTLYEDIERGTENKTRIEVYSRLRRIIKLDPSHIGALEDALAIQEELTAADWFELDKSYKPIDRVSLENALTSAVLKEKNPEFELLKSLSEQQKAHHLFILSNRYFSSDPQRCMLLLEQVLKLDPDHSEALKDLVVLKKQLSTEMK